MTSDNLTFVATILGVFGAASVVLIGQWALVPLFASLVALAAATIKDNEE